MSTDDELGRRIHRVLDREVHSLRLRSVEVDLPGRTTTVGLVPGFAWVVAAVVVVVIAGALWRQGLDGRDPVAGASSSPSPALSASPSPGPTATPTATAPAGCGAVEVGEISVCPGTAAVGTRIRIEGRGCADPGAQVHLVLVGNPSETDGTVGSYAVPFVQPDSAGRFAVEFVVPAVLDTVHGEGGGPTRPGTYRIISKPLYCGAHLTVRG